MQHFRLSSIDELKDVVRRLEGSEHGVLLFTEFSAKPVIKVDGKEMPMTPELEALLLMPDGSPRAFTIQEIERVMMSASYMTLAGLKEQGVMSGITGAVDEFASLRAALEKNAPVAEEGMFDDVIEFLEKTQDEIEEETPKPKRRGDNKYRSTYGPPNRRL